MCVHTLTHTSVWIGAHALKMIFAIWSTKLETQSQFDWKLVYFDHSSIVLEFDGSFAPRSSAPHLNVCICKTRQIPVYVCTCLHPPEPMLFKLIYYHCSWFNNKSIPRNINNCKRAMEKAKIKQNNKQTFTHKLHKPKESFRTMKFTWRLEYPRQLLFATLIAALEIPVFTKRKNCISMCMRLFHIEVTF